ncbi:MAG: hypothetical protein C0183_04755 [Roseiflexus castenholzii]|nr:MAG: hypothetical protein C0183_04755 [Roseiflexus castenholzii]
MTQLFAMHSLAQLVNNGNRSTDFNMSACIVWFRHCYNPTKQCVDNDPDAVFIHRYVPELRPLPAPLVFQPWTLTEMERQMYGVRIGIDYPAPKRRDGRALPGCRRSVTVWLRRTTWKRLSTRWTG